MLTTWWPTHASPITFCPQASLQTELSDCKLGCAKEIDSHGEAHRSKDAEIEELKRQVQRLVDQAKDNSERVLSSTGADQQKEQQQKEQQQKEQKKEQKKKQMEPPTPPGQMDMDNVQVRIAPHPLTLVDDALCLSLAMRARSFASTRPGKRTTMARRGSPSRLFRMTIILERRNGPRPSSSRTLVCTTLRKNTSTELVAANPITSYLSSCFVIFANNTNNSSSRCAGQPLQLVGSNDVILDKFH